jgi:hypothetical protein
MALQLRLLAAGDAEEVGHETAYDAKHGGSFLKKRNVIRKNRNLL